MDGLLMIDLFQGRILWRDTKFFNRFGSQLKSMQSTIWLWEEKQRSIPPSIRSEGLNWRTIFLCWCRFLLQFISVKTKVSWHRRTTFHTLSGEWTSPATISTILRPIHLSRPDTRPHSVCRKAQSSRWCQISCRGLLHNWYSGAGFIFLWKLAIFTEAQKHVRLLLKFSEDQTAFHKFWALAPEQLLDNFLPQLLLQASSWI